MALVNSFIVVDKKVLYSLIQSVIPFRGNASEDFAQTCFALIAQLSKRTVTVNEDGMILADETNCYFYLIC